MVFSNLGRNEKDAFFSLLDEYFSSRPDIFANGASSSGSGSGTPASAVRQAIASNPEASAQVMSAGLRHLANNRASATGGGSGGNSSAGAGDQPETELGSVAGRVAAAQAAFSARNTSAPDRPSSISSLTATKKFGDVDMSSKSGFVSSLRHKDQSPPSAPNIPPAFAPRQNSFAPPPVRRGPSVTPRQPSPEPAPEEEEEGEWVEALYEYDSGEAGDLKIQEGSRILLVERTSDDWWTGEVDGRNGLFPASYVKPV